MNIWQGIVEWQGHMTTLKIKGPTTGHSIYSSNLHHEEETTKEQDTAAINITTETDTKLERKRWDCKTGEQMNDKVLIFHCELYDTNIAQ